MLPFFMLFIPLMLALILVVILAGYLKSKSVRCSGGGKEHKFEPRYSESGHSLGMSGRDDFWKSVTITSTGKLPSYNKTYLHDVCIWCGMTVTAPVVPPVTPPKPAA